MFASLEPVFTAAQKHVVDFDLWAEKFTPAARADHICFKCASSQEFEQMRAMFEGSSTFIYQSIISKRRIAIVKFAEPLKTKLGDIWFLELSDQKPDNSQTSGFDHIEIYPTNGSIDDLAADLAATGVTLEKIVRPHHTTYDGFIEGTFKIRLEAEALVDKIKAMEMV